MSQSRRHKHIQNNNVDNTDCRTIPDSQNAPKGADNTLSPLDVEPSENGVHGLQVKLLRAFTTYRAMGYNNLKIHSGFMIHAMMTIMLSGIAFQLMAPVITQSLKAF